MTTITSISSRLQHAATLTSLLDAAWEGFEAIMAAISCYQDSGTEFHAALVMAAAWAADGRDAVAAAPSLPPISPAQRLSAGDEDGPGDSAPGVVSALAGLSAVAAARLARAAQSAADRQDRAACRDGARYARQIHALLTGNDP